MSSMQPASPSAVAELSLPAGVVVRLHHEAGIVESLFPDGRRCTGTREPTPENVAQAAEQGYTADAAGCWASLIDHELAHHLVAYILCHTWSYALRDEAGDPQPLVVRHWEEGIALALQHLIQRGALLPPLVPHAHRLAEIRTALEEAKGRIGVLAGVVRSV